MIFDGKNVDWADVVHRNEKINHKACTDSCVPCCGHDFWDEFKKADFGDVILCHRCNCYYAKIKNLPWVVKKKKWLTQEIVGYDTNHLGDGFAFSGTAWAVHVPVRITD